MTKRTLSIAFATLIIGLASTSMVEAKVKRGPGDPLVLLTYDLEESAHRVARHVTRGPHRMTYRQERAVQRLRVLQREARQFRHDIHRFGAWSRQVRYEYEELQRAFRHARNSFTSTRGHRWNRHTFDRVTRVMRDLDWTYENRLARYRRGHRGQRFHRPARAVHVGPGPARHAGRDQVRIAWDDEYPDGY